MQNINVMNGMGVAEGTATDLMFTGFRKCNAHRTNQCIVSCSVPTKNYASGSDFETKSFIVKVSKSTKVKSAFVVGLYNDVGAMVATCVCDEFDK